MGYWAGCSCSWRMPSPGAHSTDTQRPITPFIAYVPKWPGVVSAGADEQALGLALFILTLVQIGMGLSTHALTSRAPEALRTRSGRSPINFVHMMVGCAIVLMGWVQVYKGKDLRMILVVGRLRQG